MAAMKNRNQQNYYWKPLDIEMLGVVTSIRPWPLYRLYIMVKSKNGGNRVLLYSIIKPLVVSRSVSVTICNVLYKQIRMALRL